MISSAELLLKIAWMQLRCSRLTS